MGNTEFIPINRQMSEVLEDESVNEKQIIIHATKKTSVSFFIG